MVMRTQSTTQATVIALATFTGTLLAGCGQEFDPPSLITGTRVLGAVVQVEGDEARATPQPGETATVTWIVATPGAVPPLGWAFVVCPAGPGTDAAPCAAPPLATAQGSAAPQFRLVVPPAEMLGDASRLTILGQICEDGMPISDPQTGRPACPGAGTTVTVDIHLQRTADANHNPALAARPLWLDGVAWPADDGSLDCASLPTVAAGSKEHVIRLATLAEDRETIVTPAADPAAVPTATREMLQISSFTTDGELGQVYAFVSADDGRPESDVEVKWDAPEFTPVDGRVRFFFVARDLRGGAGVTTRTVCVQ
jgi:hypothetical protein